MSSLKKQFLILALIISIKIHAQESVIPAEPHPAVGFNIDKNEKLKYHLFPQFSYSSFDSAHFYSVTDTNYILFIYHNQNLIDTSEYSKTMFDRITTIINVQASDPVSVNKKKLLKQPKGVQKFNFHFALGGKSSVAPSELEKVFINNNYKDLGVYGWLGPAYVEGTPEASAPGIRYNIGLDYNYNKKIKFGLSVYNIEAEITGYKGNFGTQYVVYKEVISGHSFQANATYALIRNKGIYPVAFELVAGTGFLGNLVKQKTNITLVGTVGYFPIREESFSENLTSFGVHGYLRADLYFGKVFSVFLSVSQSYDSGLKVKGQNISFYSQNAYLPDHTIHFNGFRTIGGIAFHIWKKIKSEN